MSDIITNTSGLTFHYFIATGRGYDKESQEAKDNATITYNMLNQLGWSLNAIATLCGCIQAESDFNPGQTEASGYGGFGLVQWTPKTDLTIWLRAIYPEIDWSSDTHIYDGDKQINVIAGEYQQSNYSQGKPGGVNWNLSEYQQWIARNGSYYGWSIPIIQWYEWSIADNIDIETMTKMFMADYLRMGRTEGQTRLSQYVGYSQYWLDYLGGVDPGGVRYFPSTCIKGGGEQLEVIKAVQMILKGAGLYTGAIDGIVGSKTKDAMKKAGLN